MPDPRDIMGGLAADDDYRGEYPAWPPSTSYPPRVPSVLETGEPPRDLNDYMGALARPAPDTLAPPPQSDLGRDVPAFLGKQVFPNLSNPDIYAAPSAALTPNDQGKVPTANPLAMGAAADIGNTLNYAIPFGGPLKAAPAAAAGLKAIFAAAKTADRVALAQAERMAGTGATTNAIALAEPQGIRAYHSSPHDFERFDASRIGTGEGAQRYGHGLYFAENPEVSGQGGEYWNQFLHKFEGPEREIAERLKASNFDRKAVVGDMDEERAWLEYNMKHASSQEAAAKHTQMLNVLNALESGKPVGPRTYEVNINARPEQMLDWDKPLAQQPVKDAVLGLHSGVREDMTGQQARDFLLAKSWTNYAWNKYGRAPFANDAELSRVLADRGIPGIRYLDQGSRAGIPNMQAMLNTARLQDELAAATNPMRKAAIEAELAAHEKAMQPTYNHVIFPGHEHRIDIIKKYGLAGAAPAGLGALAAQDRYEQ